MKRDRTQLSIYKSRYEDHTTGDRPEDQWTGVRFPAEASIFLAISSRPSLGACSVSYPMSTGSFREG